MACCFYAAVAKERRLPEIKERAANMEFNEKLQELRKQKGLTQETLAESLYVSRTAISNGNQEEDTPALIH